MYFIRFCGGHSHASIVNSMNESLIYGLENILQQLHTLCALCIAFLLLAIACHCNKQFAVCQRASFLCDGGRLSSLE